MIKPKVTPQAFTITSNSGFLGQLITDVGISPAIDVATGQPPIKPIYFTKALWDTGCTNCAISDATSGEPSLNLKPIRPEKVQYGNGVVVEQVFPITVFLPNGIKVVGVEATSCRTPLPQPEQSLPPWGLIIGMSFINLGDFAISNQNGNTVFTWQVPSLKTFDFVKDINRVNFQNVGRNDPCPCGSGKKFKLCHSGKI